MADVIRYVYRGQSTSQGAGAVLTIYEERNGRETFVFKGYQRSGDPRITCYPDHATAEGARDGIKREKFTILERELVYKKGY